MQIKAFLDQSCWMCQVGAPLYNPHSSGQHHLPLQEPAGKSQRSRGWIWGHLEPGKNHKQTCASTLSPLTFPLNTQQLLQSGESGQFWGPPSTASRVPPPSQGTLPPTPAESKNLLGYRDFDFVQEGPSNVNMRAEFTAIRFSEI